MTKTRKRLTHCRRGHEFTPENTYVWTRGNNGRVVRECLQCKNIRASRRKRFPSDEYDRKKLLKRYNLTEQDFASILESQDGVCAICREIPKKTLHIDHDHETGRVRGLLCGSCNWGIGLLKDSEQILARAAKYLTQ